MTTDQRPAPADTETTVYVAVSRELLPRFREWSDPVQVRVDSEQDGVAVLHLRRVTP